MPVIISSLFFSWMVIPLVSSGIILHKNSIIALNWLRFMLSVNLSVDTSLWKHSKIIITNFVQNYCCLY
jgi:hypothetical protein